MISKKNELPNRSIARELIPSLLRQRDRIIPLLGAIIITLFIIPFNTNQAKAQSTKKKQKNSQLQPLHSGVKLFDLTGSLRWQTSYYLYHDFTPDNGITPDHLKKNPDHTAGAIS